MKEKIRKLFQQHRRMFLFLLGGVALLIISFSLLSLWQKNQKMKSQETNFKEQLTAISNELNELKSQDQYLRNEELQAEIKNIQETYNQAVSVYENLLSLKEATKNTKDQDEKFAEALSLLSKRNYASAAAILTSLNQNINQEKETIATKFEIQTDVPTAQTPPDSGYRRQKVETEVGSFLVDLVAADLNSTRAIVDTASESDCRNDCPVLPLATYVARNSAFAGINGSYFCPAEYPSCAGKKNSFEFLLMNKNKVYFNSDQNVYSTIPAVIFYGNTARFVTQSMQWGRDTSVDGVIANYPLLTFNGQLYFTGGDDPKQGSKGNRSFVGVTGNTVYIGVVRYASVAEAARVVHKLGIHDALNLDNGGSTALWFGGYKVGPGRNLANALLLVRK